MLNAVCINAHTVLLLRCQVFPELLELPPHGNATLRVAFRPPSDRRSYVQPLVLLVGLKAMRSYRLLSTDGQHVVLPHAVHLLVRSR